MSVIEPNWPALLLFVPAWLMVCVGLIYLSGNLPVRAAPDTVREGAGPVLVWLNVLAFAGLAIVTIIFAIAQLRWTSTIVGGGFMFLFAPFVVQDLPAGLKDTQTGLVVLLALGLVAMGCVVVLS